MTTKLFLGLRQLRSQSKILQNLRSFSTSLHLMKIAAKLQQKGNFQVIFLLLKIYVCKILSQISVRNVQTLCNSKNSSNTHCVRLASKLPISCKVFLNLNPLYLPTPMHTSCPRFFAWHGRYGLMGQKCFTSAQ